MTVNTSNPSHGSVFGIPSQHVSNVFDIETSFFDMATPINAATNSPVLRVGSGLMEADLIIHVASAPAGANASVTIEAADLENFSDAIRLLTIPIPAGHTGPIAQPFKNALGNEMPRQFIRLAVATSAAISIGAFVTKRNNTP